MKEKISVIVPVYNTANYLRRCIESIINQEYKNIELILVDDGSTDNSLDICKEYQKIDDRIKVFTKENGGQSSARNLALEHVTGQYIGFVDSDDWICLDMYTHLMKIIEESNADIAFIERKKVYKESDAKKDCKRLKIKIYREQKILEEYLDYGMKTGNYGLPNYLYSTELFKGVRFPEGRICEDIVTNYILQERSKCLVKSNKICYYYYQGNTSTTRSTFSNKDKDLLYACEELERLTKEKSYNLKKRVNEKHIRSYFSLICKIDRYGVDYELDEKELTSEYLQKFRPNLFVFLKSKAPISRKILAILICINNRLVIKILRGR